MNTEYFDHPKDSPGAAMYSSTCRQCEGTGVDATTGPQGQCDCLCHSDIYKVAAAYDAMEISMADLHIYNVAQQKGDGYCKLCMHNHKCGVCDGAGEVNI